MNFFALFSLALFGCVFGSDWLPESFNGVTLQRRLYLLTLAIKFDDSSALDRIFKEAFDDFDVTRLMNENNQDLAAYFDWRTLINPKYDCHRVFQEHGIDPKIYSEAFDSEELVQSGLADVNLQLVKAAKAGDVEFAKKLLSLGADINYIDRHGDPILVTGVQKSKEFVEFLLLAGAKMDAKDAAGETALDRAIRYEKDDIVRLLLAHKCPATNALVNAFKADLPELGVLIVEAGHPVDVDYDTDFPLFCQALRVLWQDWIELMLNAGVDVNKPCLYRGNRYKNTLDFIQDVANDPAYKYSTITSRFRLIGVARKIVKITDDLDIEAGSDSLGQVIAKERECRKQTKEA